MKLMKPFVNTWFGLSIFAFRDLKTRYAGSYLGATWILVYPLSMALVSSVVFALVFKKTVNNVPFFIYTLSGFAAWVFFVQTISSSARSLIQNRDIIVNNKVNTEIIVGGVIVSRLVDLMITTTFLTVVSLVFGVLSFNPLVFAKSMTALLLATVAISLMVAAGNVYFRDVQALVDIFLNIIFYATPIIYPISVVPERYLWVFRLNPLIPIFSGFRGAIIQIPYDLRALDYALITLPILIFIAFKIYKRLERNFAQFL